MILVLTAKSRRSSRASGDEAHNMRASRFAEGAEIVLDVSSGGELASHAGQPDTPCPRRGRAMDSRRRAFIRRFGTRSPFWYNQHGDGCGIPVGIQFVTYLRHIDEMASGLPPSPVLAASIWVLPALGMLAALVCIRVLILIDQQVQWIVLSSGIGPGTPEYPGLSGLHPGRLRLLGPAASGPAREQPVTPRALSPSSSKIPSRSTR